MSIGAGIKEGEDRHVAWWVWKGEASNAEERWQNMIAKIQGQGKWARLLVSHRAVQRDSVQPEGMLDVGCKARSELTRGECQGGEQLFFFCMLMGHPAWGWEVIIAIFYMHFMYSSKASSRPAWRPTRRQESAGRGSCLSKKKSTLSDTSSLPPVRISTCQFPLRRHWQSIGLRHNQFRHCFWCLKKKRKYK